MSYAETELVHSDLIKPGDLLCVSITKINRYHALVVQNMGDFQTDWRFEVIDDSCHSHVISFPIDMTTNESPVVRRILKS